MALYLTRMLSKGGYTLGSGADQGFTDISGQAADIQTAINQLKQAGVTTGTTATTYGPDSNVTREQMAMFMARALNKITAGPGGQSDGTGRSCRAPIPVAGCGSVDDGGIPARYWQS